MAGMRTARQKPWLGGAVIAGIVLGVNVGAQAQSPTAASLAAEDEGLTFYESLQGTRKVTLPETSLIAGLLNFVLLSSQFPFCVTENT
jgi:hypothetical protein